MFLLLDANVLVGNPLLRGRGWDAVADAVVSGALDLYVPELAIAEAVARYREGAAVRERALAKGQRSWPSPSRVLIGEAIAASRSFSDDYERLLRERLEVLGAVVVDYPEVGHAEVARRAITRAAPFDASGNGYRDALHWHTFLELLWESESEDPVAVLMSADKRAFGAARQAALRAEADALGLGWDVQFVQGIAEFEVPGQFLDEEGELTRAQECQLHRAVEDGLLAGGVPQDFTQVIANSTSFDVAEIAEVTALRVDVGRVQVERKSRDLWITYTAEATVRIELESVETLNDEGDYYVAHDVVVWELTVEGSARSTGNDVEEVVSLRLITVDRGLEQDSM